MPDALPLRDQVQKTLGDSYTLERELSGGGMSHVFVAEDKSLGRKIVVKVLPLDATAAVSVERFKREIQVAARLQHPHIVPLLSAGEIDGLPFYTMPFVKGESLRARVSRGGELSVNEAVHYLRDVAAALAYAHGEGVVHRDIKPDNVIVSGGIAVVTDFGVSKAIDVAATAGDKDPSGITSIGVALGTPAYMSPEQASADPHVDHRADIYSFGCLAYELLAGSSPFAGRPPQQMLAAHVSERPESIAKRRPTVPPALASLVMKCLEKRSGDRPQTADELLTALDAVGTPSGGMAPTTEHSAGISKRRKIVTAGIAAVALVALVGFLWSRSGKMIPYGIGETIPIAVSPDLESSPALSPDGKVVAYVRMTPDGNRIFLRQIDGGRATMLTNEIEGDQGCPQWSPDGSRVSFCGSGGIYEVAALTGGTPKLIVPDGIEHAWSKDGTQIVYSDFSSLWVVPAKGGKAQKIRSAAFIHAPTISPNGRLIAYSIGRPPQMANLSSNSIWVSEISGANPQRVSDSTHVNLSPVWAPDGKSILYVSARGGVRDVYQQQVNSSGDVVGDPVRITTGLGSYAISISADGSRLAYDVVRNYSNIYEVPLGSGTVGVSAGRQVTRENQHIEMLSMSHDGKWLAYDSDRSGNFDIYKLRLEGGDPVQVTNNKANDFAPSWAPDDKSLVFHTTRNGNRDIYSISAEGNDEEQITSGPDQDYFGVLSRDGKQLAFAREGGMAFSYLVIARLPNGKWSEPRVVSESGRLRSTQPAWSLDDKLLAITHSDGLVLVPLNGDPRQLLASVKQLGGLLLGLEWARDGQSIYAFAGGQNGTGAILQVPLNGGTIRKILVSEPNALFGRWLFTTDGRRLFYTRANWEADVWVMDLKR